MQAPLLNNNGRVRPGAPLGTLTVAGNDQQQSVAALDIDLFRLGNTDVLSVEGSAALNGTLALSCLAECSFAAGDSIVILDATGALSGTSASVTMTGFATGAFDVVDDNVATQVRLHVTEAVTAVPEPGTNTVWIAGLVLLTGAFPRRARRASTNSPNRRVLAESRRDG